MNWFKNLFGRSKATVTPQSTDPYPPTLASLHAKYSKLAKPAIHLRPAETSAFSQLGGQPLLPDDFTWPEWNGKPQSFLAQLDLSEIHHTLPSFLPSTGLLYFFYDQEQSVWGFDPKDRGGWQVFYFNGDRSSLKLRPIPDGIEKHARFKAKPVRFQAVQTLPQSPEGLDWDIEGDTYSEFSRKPFEGLIPHQVLGHPCPVQGDDMELECQLASNGLYVGNSEGYQDPRAAALGASAKDWKLLLQLDTDDETDWMWGDCGTLYFWIREQDAARADFSKTWMVFQCC